MELKRIYSTGTIIVICAIIATIQAVSAAPTVNVEPSYLSASQGDTFTVNITIDSDGTEVMGAQYTLYFDNVLLKALNQNRGSFLRQDGKNTNVFKNKIYNTIGEIKYGETRIDTDVGVITPGVLSAIEFEVRSSGVGELRLDNVKLSDTSYIPQEIPGVTINNATVEIAQSQPSTPFLIRGYVSYEDGSGCNNPTVNVTNLDTCKEWTAETNEISNYYRIVLSSCDDVIAGETLQFNATSPDGSQSNTTEHTITQDEVNDGGIFSFNITLASPAVPPTLVGYTISNRTITPPQTTDINVKFSEKVEWKIAIENGGAVHDWTGTSTDPNKKTWDGTYEENGTTVPDDTYIVNVTWTNTTTYLGGQNNTETITVSTSPDNTAPIITNIANTTPTTDSVTITWTTDEASDSLVRYGTTSGTYTDNASDATSTTSHSIDLSGLGAGTLYYFVINSTDASNNSNESEEHNFTTAAVGPPELISCVITPTPPVVQGNNVSIDCLFSEGVDYEIRIENATGALIENIGSGTATNPDPKWWNTTTGTPAGTYIVNVTMDNSASGLSSYNDMNTIEVTAALLEMPTVSIGSAEGKVGDTVNVSINITDASSIGAMDIRVTYNASILNGTNVMNGSIIESLPAPLVAYHIGSVTINISFITYPEGINGDGELFIVAFNVIGGEAGDSSPLEIEAKAYKTDLSPVTVETRDGVANVTDGAADTTPPTIIGNSPTGADVPVTTTLNVTFDEAMNKTSAEGAFSITPDTAGAFSWNENTMIFDADLAHDTTYNITISTDAKDLAGNPLAEPFTWNFTTTNAPDYPPYLVAYTISNTTISPNGDWIMDDTSIDVEFSETVDATILIENTTGVVKSLYISPDEVTNPDPQTWNGTDDDDNTVTDGAYRINITMDDGVNPLVYNNTRSITVANMSVAIISIGNASGNVTIPITIENGTNVGAVDIMLTFNASVVNVTNVTGGDFDAIITHLEHLHEGWVRIGAFQTDNPGLNGNITFANVTFRSNSTNGTSPLNLSVITLKDATPDCNEIPYIVQNGTYIAALNGDVNGDGVVDIADAMYLAKHVLGKSGFEEIIEEVADVNDDGIIDIADAMYLAKHVLGKSGFEELR